METEIVKHVQRWGNSSGILLPREWLNKEVKIILIDRSLNIKNEVFDILNPYLDDIIGIYITGSYSRGEEENDSDIDIVAISSTIKKEIISGKYNISIIPYDTIEKTLKNNPIMILPRLLEARTITNSQLLNKLKGIKISKDSFKDYIKDTRRIIKINEGLLNLEENSTCLESNDIIYSIILRLRGIYLINCIIENRKYSKKDFLKYIKRSAGDEYLDAYEAYNGIKNNKKSKIKISVKTAKELIKLLKKEVDKV
jgi:predicted nucleotidyltransferase